MKILDLFSGLRGWSDPWKERGHEVFTVDNDPRFEPDLCADVLTLWPPDLPWSPDVVLASPPCEAFSVASIGTHWRGGRRAYIPKTDHARLSEKLVAHVVALIQHWQPSFFIIENPRGVLRKLGLIPWERRTVTYCQYGEGRMKPTDLWGRFPDSLILYPPCRNGDPCHERAPRGSKTGTQGIGNAANRAKVPRLLSLAACLAAEKDTEGRLVA